MSFVACFFIVCILVVYYLYSNRFIQKGGTNTGAIKRPTTITSNFPLGINDFDMYAFNCFVTNIIDSKIDIKTNKTIHYGIECEYYDSNLKPHTITVPLISSNQDNDYLASNRFYDSDTYNWSVSDYLTNISRFFYLNSADQSRYDDPHSETGNYFNNPNAIKPEISSGDIIAISFALEDSNIFTDSEYRAAASFFKSYHEEIIGYNNIETFLESGSNPELLFTENNTWIVPTWVIFIDDIL